MVAVSIFYHHGEEMAMPEEWTGKKEKHQRKKAIVRTILVTNDLPRSLYTCCKSCCCGGRLGTAAVITSKPQWGVKTFLLSCVSEMDGHFFYKQLVTESVGSYSTTISQGNFLHSDPKMNRIDNSFPPFSPYSHTGFLPYLLPFCAAAMTWTRENEREAVLKHLFCPDSYRSCGTWSENLLFNLV